MENLDLVNLLTTYQGRINRAKYWIAVAVFVVFAVIIFILNFLLAALGSVGWFLAILMFIVAYLAMAVLGAFVGIKRLHDRDKSGWWLVLFYGLPIAFNLLASWTGMTMIFSLISFAVSIWALVELGCLRGTVGPNQYGPDPLTT